MQPYLSINCASAPDLVDIKSTALGWPYGKQVATGWLEQPAGIQFASSQYWGALPAWTYGATSTQTGNPGLQAALVALSQSPFLSRGLAELLYLPGDTADEKLAYYIDNILPRTIDYQMANAGGGAIDATYTGIIPLDWEPNFHYLRSDVYTGITTFLSLYVAELGGTAADAYRCFKAWDKAISKATTACFKQKMPYCKVVKYAAPENAINELDPAGTGNDTNAVYSDYCTQLAGSGVTKTNTQAITEQNDDNSEIWADRNLDAIALHGYLNNLVPIADAKVARTNVVLPIASMSGGSAPTYLEVHTGGTSGATGQFISFSGGSLNLTNCTSTFVNGETVTSAGGRSGTISGTVTHSLLEYNLTAIAKQMRRVALEVQRCANMGVAQGRPPKPTALWLQPTGEGTGPDGLAFQPVPLAWVMLMLNLSIEIGVRAVIVWEQVSSADFPYRGITFATFKANVITGLANITRALNLTRQPMTRKADALGNGAL